MWLYYGCCVILPSVIRMLWCSSECSQHWLLMSRDPLHVWIRKRAATHFFLEKVNWLKSGDKWPPLPMLSRRVLGVSERVVHRKTFEPELGSMSRRFTVWCCVAQGQSAYWSSLLRVVRGMRRDTCVHICAPVGTSSVSYSCSFS